MRRISHRKKILVIGDEAPIRAIIIRHLSVAGFRVSGVSNGMDGFRAAAKAPPDVIICDIMASELSGVEVCKRLRTFPDTMQTPILFISASSDNKEREGAVMAGAQAFLSKPFRKQDLLDSLQSVINNNTVETPGALEPEGGPKETDEPVEDGPGVEPPADNGLERAFADVYEENAILYDMGPIFNTIDDENILLREALSMALSALDTHKIYV